MAQAVACSEIGGGVKVDELTRLAFIWAEQDRRSLAECWPAESKERRQCGKEAEALRNYRLKKWGRTKLEVILEDPTVRSIGMQEIKDLHTASGGSDATKTQAATKKEKIK